MDGGIQSPAQLRYRSRKRTWVVFLVLVILLFILQLAAGAGLMALVVIRGFERHRKELPLAEQDQAVLIRIGDLVADGAEPDESLLKWRDHRGATHLLSRGRAKRERGPVRVYCEVQVATDPDGATQYYLWHEMNSEAWQYIDPEGALLQTAQSDLYPWGDQHLIYTLSRDGRPAGIFFLARRGGTVFLLAVSGRKLDDKNLLSMLLGPVLREVEIYKQ